MGVFDSFAIENLREQLDQLTARVLILEQKEKQREAERRKQPSRHL